MDSKGYVVLRVPFEFGIQSKPNGHFTIWHDQIVTVNLLLLKFMH